jgi:hypothetical protein
MPDSPLQRVKASKDLFGRVFFLVDQRVQRMLANAPGRSLGEYALEMGIADEANGLTVGQQMTVSSPWNGDAFSLRIWVDDGTPIGGQAPAVPPTVMIAFSIGHSGFPYERIPLAPPYIVSGETLLQDVTSVTESDVAGGTNASDFTGLALTLSSFATQLFAGDKIFGVVTALSGTPHLVGVELLCRLRGQQYTTVSGAG